MPDSASIGTFTLNVAKLTERGPRNYVKGALESFTDTYTVVVADDGVEPTPDTVSGLPEYDSKYSANSNLRVRDIKFTQKDPRSLVWTVAVSYKSTSITVHQQGSEDDRGTDWDVSWGTAESSSDVTSDLYEDSPLVNSAGDPFDSVPQKTCFAPEITLETDSATFPAAYARSGFVNSEPITICGVKFGRNCAMLRVSVSSSGNARRPFHVTYTVTGRVNCIPANSVPTWLNTGATTEATGDIGWNEALVQCGFNCMTGSEAEGGGEKVKITITDAEGNVREPSVPMPLDENGLLADAPAIRVIRVYPQTSFSAFGFPVSADRSQVAPEESEGEEDA